MSDIENVAENVLENATDSVADNTAENDNNNYNMISRYKKREQAFILSFESLFTDCVDVDELADNAVDGNDEHMSDYAIMCAKGILENSQQIDELISANLKKGWKLNRISKVSLAVMRLAIFEMLFVEDVPVSVSINEAVEIAKKYSVPDDSSFVNGVLGAVAKSINE
ncbi:MAG: transcription antitermination factor NusB [Ruminococcus sp.]|nr:transcription antitermination factor NusB [Ruminococcus sp.]